ncbi:MAG: peptidase M50 [Nanoarchaeota archaeon]|nr:peptidase M50 [Nanoarchaeota archaeon]
MYYDKQSYKTIRLGSVSTSEIELRDLLKAWAAISFAFAILFSGGLSFGQEFAMAFIISCLTVGVGFIFHEMGHKFVAQHYGCFAEFRSDDRMLIFAILLSFLGFIIAAPGAVMISGPVGRIRNGKISAAGPAVNFALALVFLACIIILGKNMLFDYGFRINALLGVFNLIPIGIFDGKKVLHWDKKVYALMVVVGLSLMVLQGFV